MHSTESLEEFVGALEQGRVGLNIHTDKCNDGEISGEVVPVDGAPMHHG